MKVILIYNSVYTFFINMHVFILSQLLREKLIWMFNLLIFLLKEYTKEKLNNLVMKLGLLFFNKKKKEILL